jgi:hypothetical protein
MSQDDTSSADAYSSRKVKARTARRRETPHRVGVLVGFALVAFAGGACQRETATADPAGQLLDTTPNATALVTAPPPREPPGVGAEVEAVPAACVQPLPRAQPQKRVGAARVGTARVTTDSPALEHSAGLPIMGKVEEGEGYRVWLQSDRQHKAGQPGSVDLVLTASPPYKCNDKYPYKFKFDTNPGVQHPTPIARSMKVSSTRSTLSLPFTPNGAGPRTISGELSFSVCTEDRCLVERAPLSITLDIAG